MYLCTETEHVHMVAGHGFTCLHTKNPTCMVDMGLACLYAEVF